MERKPSHPATADEETIRQALAALRQDDMLRLERIARILTKLTLGRDHQDLLQEAVLRTLAGQRRWNMRVDFPKHLFESMRSIASSWRKQKREESEASRLPRDASLDRTMLDAESTQPGAESLMDAKERLEAICADFRDSPVASQVIDGWRMGCSGPEIQELGEISKKDYEAAVKRIRRRAQKKEAGYA